MYLLTFPEQALDRGHPFHRVQLLFERLDFSQSLQLPIGSRLRLPNVPGRFFLRLFQFRPGSFLLPRQALDLRLCLFVFLLQGILFLPGCLQLGLCVSTLTAQLLQFGCQRGLLLFFLCSLYR